MEKKNALVLEDQAIHKIVINNYLTLKGYTVDVVSDGLEGLKKIKEKKYDLVFSDIEMPNMNGLEFLKNCKREPAYKFIPVIMLTTVTDESILNKAKILGAYSCLKKPFTSESMNAVLESIKKK